MIRIHNITMTSEHCRRMQALLNSDFAAAIGNQPYLETLRDQIRRAEIVNPVDMPSDVVSMNSMVRLMRTRDREQGIFTLVYPEAADIAQGRLSVLAPLGAAILGCRVGTMIQREFAGSSISIRIEQLLYQPERDLGAVNSEDSIRGVVVCRSIRGPV